jgi:hypothetical protein
MFRSEFDQFQVDKRSADMKGETATRDRLAEGTEATR